jgi:hypothetical protein
MSAVWPYARTMPMRPSSSIGPLRSLFGYAASVPDSEIYPLASTNFVDAAERACLIERLTTSGSVTGYRARLRRPACPDLTAEITATVTAIDERFVNCRRR